jgi:hypothetical protein
MEVPKNTMRREGKGKKKKKKKLRKQAEKPKCFKTQDFA